MNVNGKVLVVTGGGNGMGREITLQLLKKGSAVAAVDINMKGLEETHSLSGNNKNLSLHQVDITNRQEVMALVEEVLKRHGKVDGIVNNAGIIQPFILFKDMTDDMITRVMDVNFYGTMNMVQAFLPELEKRPEAHILNVSSMGGFFPVPGQSMYGVSKAGVKLLTEALATEMKGTGVNVSVVIPGAIATDIKKNSHIGGEESKHKEDGNKLAEKMMMTPEVAAGHIIKTIEKNKTMNYIGTDCKMMKTVYKLSPKLASKLISKVLDPDKH